MSRAVDPEADYEALRHWILAVDEREKLSEMGVAQPLMPGARHSAATPQFILNPLFRRISELTDEIRRTEDAFGMNPLSRFRLQLTYEPPTAEEDEHPIMAMMRKRREEAAQVARD